MMEMTLEELLNKLIEKGWKPYGYKGMKATVNIYGETRFEREGHFFIETFRTLTSKESGLWQFVCENGMVEEDSPYYTSLNDDKILCTSDEWICYYNCDGYPKDNYYKLERMYYEFWVVESALCDENELEQFLLDNIKIYDK